MSAARVRRAQWDSGGVRALRKHLGLTQQEFADELGTRQQTISEWETGMYKPRGASATLLTIIAERANFVYRVSEGEQSSRSIEFDSDAAGEAPKIES